MVASITGYENEILFDIVKRISFTQPLTTSLKGLTM
jgi:hypothetical protein